MNIVTKKLMLMAASAAYIALGLMSSITKADDTEVYFYSGGLVTPGKPQIVLSLDISRAMSGAGHPSRLDMVRAALKAVPSAILYDADGNSLGTVQDNADLSLVAMSDGPDLPVLFHMNQIHHGGSTAAYDPTKNDRSWDDAVDIIPIGKGLTGNTPLEHGLEEVGKYMLGKSVGHATYQTDSFAYDRSTKNYNGFAGGNSCGSTTLVVMALGQLNGTGYSPHITNELIGAANAPEYCTPSKGKKECNGFSVIDYLNTEHQIKTYTVTPDSTGRSYDNLALLSQKGGTGSPISFSNATDLATKLANIIEEVVRQGTSFVQAGVTVSQQNRLRHDNQLYYAQFQPDGSTRWPGNLKKYKFKTDAIRDSLDVSAVDLTTGLFKDTSYSYWSASLDGNNVKKGGITTKLKDFFTFSGTGYTSTRHVYTDLAGATDKLSNVTSSDLAITSGADIGQPGKTQAEATTLLKQWMEGVLYNKDAGIFQTRGEVGDPLHSEPKLLRYKVGGTDAAPVLKTLSIFGTNEGFVHAVDTDDAAGTEVWSYVPGQLLEVMKELFLTQATVNPEDHIYGVDGEITIAHADTNFNLYVDNGETVMMYFGMRRGTSASGVSSYYGLDISKPGIPELAFDIHSTDVDFTDMGQTWGQPTIANVKVGGTTKAVMLFSGGYDTNQDTAATATTTDTVGTKIYMVNALDGSHIWSSTAQNYSMVGKLNTFGTNNQGLADHFYAVNMGGEIYRYDIDNASNTLSITGKKIAALQGAGGAVNNRRFYYAPSIGFFAVPGGDNFISISVGSGYRAHPLDETVIDHFYSIRDTGVFNKTFPATPYGLGNLVDVTTELDSATIKAELAGVKKGWYIRLPKGEKVISEAGTAFGKVLFTSYIPTAKLVNACTPVVGVGKLYALNLADGTPIGDLDNDGDEDADDRYVDLITPGIAPPAQLLYIPDHTTNADGIVVLVGGQNVATDLGSEGAALVANLPPGYDGVKRMSWKKVEQ